jgi:phosphotransferase system HPr-like phosphotransfer protein
VSGLIWAGEKRSLRCRGFQVWIKKTNASEAPARPDITITGQVQQLSAQARSRFFSTRMTAKARIVIQAANASDRSTVRLNLDGTREDAVFWFEPREVQELVNRMLKENLDRLLADVYVKDRALLTK